MDGERLISNWNLEVLWEDDDGMLYRMWLDGYSPSDGTIYYFRTSDGD